MQPGVKSVQNPPELRPAPGKPPPMDLDAEAAVLSTLVLKPDDYDVVAGIVTAAHFYSDANRHLFASIASLREAGSPIDVVTVSHWLKTRELYGVVGGSPYLYQIIEATPAVANVVAHAEIVRDKWIKRQMISKCHVYMAEAYHSPEDGRTLVQQAEADLATLSSTGFTGKFTRVGEIVDVEVDRLRQEKQNGITFSGVTTGFSRLNRATAGLHDGDLTIIAGRPGMGKSAMATNLAANVARVMPDSVPIGVGVFSLEMPKEQLAIRIACAERGINVANVRRNVMNPEEWSELAAAAHEITKMPLWIDDTAAISLLELRARTRKLQRDIAAGRMGVPCSRLGLIVVDYLQLMQGTRERNSNREQEVASLSRGLKQLAKDASIPVIALAQLNRNVEKKSGKDKRPQLSDLRESGSIEQDADNVWFLFRPEYYDEEAPKGEAELIIAKQRNGPLETIEMQFRGASMRFYERISASADREFEDEFETV